MSVHVCIPSPALLLLEGQLMPISLSWDDSVQQLDKQFKMSSLLLRTAQLVILRLMFLLFLFIKRSYFTSFNICS
jgi:hypothetical protein